MDKLLVTADEVNEVQQRVNMLPSEYREQQETMSVAESDMVSELEVTLEALVEELRHAMPGGLRFSAH